MALSMAAWMWMMTGLCVLAGEDEALLVGEDALRRRKKLSGSQRPM
jgi:hypothetical protein